MSEKKSMEIVQVFQPVNLDIWQTIQSIAPVTQASRMFGVTEEQAAIVMLLSYELGLGIATAFQFFNIIDGKPSLKPKGALALIQRSGQMESIDIEETTDSNGKPFGCQVTMTRRNGFAYSVIFTMDDAKRAGLVKDKSGWVKYPANMLRWRAVGYCADIVFPDVIGGMYRPEELGANVTPDGDVIDGIWEEAEEIPFEQVMPDEPTIQDLMSEGWTAEQIMAANSGTIPATAEECAKVKQVLEQENT
jgi:hypothetical protein